MKAVFEFGIILVILSEHFIQALKCFKCTQFPNCSDKWFQDYEQELVECDRGACVKYTENGKGIVKRYCSSIFINDHCESVTRAGQYKTTCYCSYRDGCNGPRGAENATHDGLRCYDCFYNTNCLDINFNGDDTVTVNCGTGSCVKTKLRREGLVYRHCSPERLEADCRDIKFFGEEAVTCACHEADGCNNASFIHVTSVKFGLLLFLRVLFY